MQVEKFAASITIAERINNILNSLYWTKRRQSGSLVLAALLLLFMFAYGWLAITRHQRFNSTGFDLAINEQILWNTLNGRFFASSLEVGNSFADHFRPFLLVVLPFYALFQRAETLLIMANARSGCSRHPYLSFSPGQAARSPDCPGLGGYVPPLSGSRFYITL